VESNPDQKANSIYLPECFYYDLIHLVKNLTLRMSGRVRGYKLQSRRTRSARSVLICGAGLRQPTSHSPDSLIIWLAVIETTAAIHRGTVSGAAVSLFVMRPGDSSATICGAVFCASFARFPGLAPHITIILSIFFRKGDILEYLFKFNQLFILIKLKYK
jgi:hypothetical protein